MKSFTYISPGNLKEASKLLGDDWQGALALAGGTDILNLMKNQIENPDTVVNLKNIPGLNSIEYKRGEGMSIGALVTISELATHPDIKSKYTVLYEAAREIASPQLRNMGTIGGNLCQRPQCWYYRYDFPCLRKGGKLCYAVVGKNKYHCVIGGGPCFIVHPSDTAVALLALDANVIIFNGKRERIIPISEFFVLPRQDLLRENILKPDEIVTKIQIPDVNENVKSGYYKFKERGIWDFAIVSVAAVIERKGNKIANARIALGGVAPKPWLESDVSQRLIDLVPDEDKVASICEPALSEASPLTQNGYKVKLARNLMKRMILNVFNS